MSRTDHETAISQLPASLLYSEELCIRLRRNTDDECFKWFLASILYGARISATTAKNTYRAFERHHLVTPQAILEAGWNYLVDPIMREGGYVRYDGRKSTQVLRDCASLVEEWGGSLKRLHASCHSPDELEQRLCDFYGVGPVTANIFLRELRPFWRHADPDPLPAVLDTAAELGIDLRRIKRKSLAFTRLEAGLLRLAHARKRRKEAIRAQQQPHL